MYIFLEDGFQPSQRYKYNPSIMVKCKQGLNVDKYLSDII